jgi:hypothetical protein
MLREPAKTIRPVQKLNFIIISLVRPRELLHARSGLKIGTFKIRSNGARLSIIFE